MTDQIRQAFEKWAITILGDNPNWRESGDCELAWQSYKAAIASLEQVGDFLHQEYGGWQQLSENWRDIDLGDDQFSSDPTPLYRIKEKS